MVVADGESAEVVVGRRHRPHHRSGQRWVEGGIEPPALLRRPPNSQARHHIPSPTSQRLSEVGSCS